MATVAKLTINVGLDVALSAQGSRELLCEQVAARFAPQNTRRMERLICHLGVCPINDKNFRRMTKQYPREIGKLSVLMSCNGAPFSQTGAVNSGQSDVLDYFAVRADRMLELGCLTLECPSTKQTWWKLYAGGSRVYVAAVQSLIHRLWIQCYTELVKAFSVLVNGYPAHRAESSEPHPKTLKNHQRWKQRDRQWRLQRVNEIPYSYRFDTVITR